MGVDHRREDRHRQRLKFAAAANNLSEPVHTPTESRYEACVDADAAYAWSD